MTKKKKSSSPAAVKDAAGHVQWNGSDWVRYRKKNTALDCAKGCPACK
jgi:hypothetical protein